MPETVLTEPDAAFIKDVIAHGGGSLKKCFQCGICSVVCALSPEDAPFPRKQMIAAQWGLKDRVAADPAIWLCHNCGDCTKQCPRGARPGDVIGALRRAAIKHYAFPAFVGRLVASPEALPFLLLLPVLVFLGVALWAPKGEPTREFEFANVFPIGVLEPLFLVVAGLALAAFGVGLARFVGEIRASGAGGAILAGLIPALVLIISHRRFRNCTKERGRWLGHLLTFSGFVGLAFMGAVVGVGTMAGVMRTPLALTDPLKIFANLSALIILAGSLMLLIDRVKDPAKRAASTYFDWAFLVALAGAVLTGIASEILRLVQAASVMYVVYFVHLVLVFSLFLYAPYSKFAHLVYRTVAIAAERVKRN
jgi:quinone-modifying oxidoreductase subunit QmoC